MNLTRKDTEDYTTFASVANKHCGDFKLSELSANNFKCLIFVQGLVSAYSGFGKLLISLTLYFLRQSYARINIANFWGDVK